MTVVYRHTRLVRITHWVNSISFLFLVPSGIAILIAHPEFYWGETGYFGIPAVLSFPIEPNFDHSEWGRNMHFVFAWALVINGLVYLVSSLLNGHVRRRLLPGREQLRSRHILSQIREHLRLRLPRGEAALQYNVLQKITYLSVVFLLFPLAFLTGLTMAPGVTAAIPELLDLFGGRQSARTIHFIVASLLVLFLVVHIAQVIVASAVNEMRSMFTGRLVIDPEDG